MPLYTPLFSGTSRGHWVYKMSQGFYMKSAASSTIHTVFIYWHWTEFSCQTPVLLTAKWSTEKLNCKKFLNSLQLYPYLTKETFGLISFQCQSIYCQTQMDRAVQNDTQIQARPTSSRRLRLLPALMTLHLTPCEKAQVIAFSFPSSSFKRIKDQLADNRVTCNFLFMRVWPQVRVKNSFVRMDRCSLTYWQFTAHSKWEFSSIQRISVLTLNTRISPNMERDVIPEEFSNNLFFEYLK